MLEATHPSTYSIYWSPSGESHETGRLRRPNALIISLAAFALATVCSGGAVASRLSHLPDVSALPVIPEHAEAMNAYPVVERSEIVLATVQD